MQGVALTKVPKVKFVVIVGGAKFRSPSVVDKAYSSPISCPSLHFLGTPLATFYHYFLEKNILASTHSWLNNIFNFIMSQFKHDWLCVQILGCFLAFEFGVNYVLSIIPCPPLNVKLNFQRQQISEEDLSELL